MRTYELRHVVVLEETNVLGNVYFVHHLRWQGHCRELFLRDEAPGVIPLLGERLVLVTLRCTCEYLAELAAFDEIVVRLRLGEVVQNRVTLLFETFRCRGDEEELVARGEQQVASMRSEAGRLVPIPLPDELKAALHRYA